MAITIERPLIILGIARSGTTMLFELLSRSPELFTIGGESHFIEQDIDSLNPHLQGYVSHALTAAHATPAVRRELRERFARQLRDRDGYAPAVGAVRMLEKTPRNVLRVPFLHAVFPDAFFVFLHRDARGNASSMLDAWRLQRLVTFPNLPGWTGLAWSLVLIPGWRNLIGRPLPEIVGTQWATAMNILLDDLASLPPGRLCVTEYSRIVENPAREVARICAFAGLEWDEPVPAVLPPSESVLTPLDERKVERNAADLALAEPFMRAAAARARAFVAAHGDL